jgi:hypothetical protein
MMADDKERLSDRIDDLMKKTNFGEEIEEAFKYGRWDDFKKEVISQTNNDMTDEELTEGIFTVVVEWEEKFKEEHDKDDHTPTKDMDGGYYNKVH